MACLVGLGRSPVSSWPKEPGAIYVELTNQSRSRLAVMGRFVPPLQYRPPPAA